MVPNSAAARATSTADIQQAAVAVSRLLRDAKIDAALRAKVAAALLLAAIRSDVPASTLDAVDQHVVAAIWAAPLSDPDKLRLKTTLRLATGEFDRLTPLLSAINDVLAGLNPRSCLSAGMDFLGLFYEAFLRYGYDNNALGIVFTPRHITRFCVDVVGVGAQDRVIDIACGTGGFLVAAHDRMAEATFSTETQRHRANQNNGIIEGTDTNPTVWALATLNLLFRGGSGPAFHIAHDSCFDPLRAAAVCGRFTRAFLNPPFSQQAEPERDFIDASMAALAPGARCAVVVKAGIFADDEHAAWRAAFVRRHRVLSVVSLPEDLFYPTSAPTSILFAEAGTPQPPDAPVLMARVWNDGFEKLKNKRVERPGCELPEVLRCFHAMLQGRRFTSSLAVPLEGSRIAAGNEWSPQEWLPQPALGPGQARKLEDAVVGSILRAVTDLPELADAVLDDFTAAWRELPPLPRGHQGPITDFFHVANGRSAGEKHYRDGESPYISSGDASNSIVRLVDAEDEGELFPAGGITVTAFGQACVQPWPFLARGNGGSSVRVLVPRFRMSFADLASFAAQINAQRWRFFYARMAIKSRIERLIVTSPALRQKTEVKPMTETKPMTEAKPIAARVREFRRMLEELGRL